MHVCVLAIGKKMPAWVSKGSDEYVKRLPARWKFSWREFAQAQASTSELAMAREADTLLQAVPDRSHVVALDNRGSAWSTPDVAGQLRHWQTLGRNLTLIIGGPDGLHDTVRARADQQWSLSALTFPHPLVRVILVEQLYRAQSLIDNHPYHRA